MPFAVIRTQRDKTRLYLRYLRDDPEAMCWTPVKTEATPFNLEESATLVANLINAYTTNPCEVVGHNPEDKVS